MSGSTLQRSVQNRALHLIGLLTPLHRLYPLPGRRASSLHTAFFGFHLALDTLALQLTLLLAACGEDFHLLASVMDRLDTEFPAADRGFTIELLNMRQDFPD